jgi:hypothetical protein
MSGDWSDLLRVVMAIYLVGLAVASIFVFVGWRAFPNVHIAYKVVASVVFVWLFMLLYIKGILALNSIQQPSQEYSI